MGRNVRNVLMKSENSVGELPKSKFVSYSRTHCKKSEKEIKIQPVCSLGSQYGKPSEGLKRGSMYQSSREVATMVKEIAERRKIDSTCCEDAFLSFYFDDSLPHSQPTVQFSVEKCSALASSNSESKPSDINRSPPISSRPVDILELSFRDLPDKPLDSDNSCPGFFSEKNMSADEQLENYLNFISETEYQYVAPEFTEVKPSKKNESDYGSKLGSEGFNAFTFEKDDEKTRTASQVDHTILTSCYKKKSESLEPVSKSKLFQALSPMKTESLGREVTELASTRRHRKFCKSLLRDFSKTTNKPSFHPSSVHDGQTTASSPAHLHGILKVDNQSGSPSFKFSVEDPGDVLSANSWRTGNAFSWVYTFHNSSKKIVNTGHNTRGSKGKHGQTTSVVGQMQVSCYLCSEVSENGAFANSLVTEFISYDIAQARRNFPIEERPQCSANSIHPLIGNDDENNYPDFRTSVGNGFCSSETETSTSYPWSPAHLLPHHETAAIMIQVPFNRKESSKELKSIITKEKQSFWTSSAVMKAVTPSGAHGLPENDEGGPSSLIDRLRYGGGCDCGGWDMGCPISVFENDHLDHSSFESQKPVSLFLQGSKENLPAVSMTADGKGQYMVDFHARLSTLQAFSICIAILHSSEVSSAVVEENNRQRLYTSSLKLLVEEELRHLVEAFTVEEKSRVDKGAEQRQTFLLEPPISPISRA